jgi:hypothetical protein
MALTQSILAGLFPAHDLPPSVRARIELLRAQASEGFTVTCGGVSMEPVIRRGEEVHVFDRPPRIGDVAAFVTRRGELELHRLVARAPVIGWWVHGGDNQSSPTLGLVHTVHIVGIAVGRERPPGWRDRIQGATRLAVGAWRLARRADDGEDTRR